MIEFVHPWAFILLPLPLLVIWLAPVYKESKSSVRIPYFSNLVEISGEEPQEGAVKLNRNFLQRCLVAIAWLCIVLGLAKPELIGSPVKIERSSRDLMVAVDLSGSMSVEDFTTEDGRKVNRLVAVKEVLQGFVQGRKGDRLGLILFGDAPYLQAPFTADNDAWLSLLNESEIGMAGQSTAFGDAIGLAISAFEKSKTKHRVLIVLTDGNDTGSKVPPIDAAKVAAAYDIKIYAIAVGDPTAVGEEKVDLDVLNAIADSTGGKSFQAFDREQLQAVYEEIDDMEPEAFDSQTYRPKTSVHYYPIAILASLYLIALLIVSVKIRVARTRLKHG